MGKKRRSAEFKKNSQVIDIEKAREERRKKRRKQTTQKEKTAGAQTVERRKKPHTRFVKRKLICTVILLIVLAVVGVSVYNVISLKAEQESALREKAALEKQRDRLKAELKETNTPEYIEQQAREQLNLVMPGEKIYVFPKLSKEDSDKTTEQDKTNGDGED